MYLPKWKFGCPDSIKLGIFYVTLEIPNLDFRRCLRPHIPNGDDVALEEEPLLVRNAGAF